MPDIMIYGEIGWDVSSRDIVDQLRAAPPGPLSVRLNTPGGSVFEGLAIASHIRARGDVTTHIDGLAASMGSIIFLSGSKRVMAPGTFLMIHNPSSGAWGEADDLRKEAGVLDVIAEEMAKLYAEASGGKLDQAQARAMMDAETWLTPDQAMEYGFCHEVSGSAQAFAKLTKRTMYNNLPKEIKMENPTEKPAGLLDRLVAMVTVKADPEIIAKLDEASAALESLRTEHAEASAALVDAAAKLGAKDEEIKALAASHSDEIARLTAAHTEAIAAARIEGEQTATAQMLTANAPPPLSHSEPDPEQPGTKSEQWMKLYNAGKFDEAAEFRRANLNAIQRGE